MYAITGAFGQTGSAVCNALIEAGRPLRLLVRRDDELAATWRAKGAAVVVVDLMDAAGLTEALRGVEGAYLLNPPAYLDNDLFQRARDVHRNLIAAANAAAVPHVVALSSVGAQHAQGTGNILTTFDFEQQLQGFQGRLSTLRAANFMENWAWSMKPVLEHGVLPSMFLPLDRTLPMVSALDIGRAAAEMLINPPPDKQIVELHGPEDVSPADAAATFAALLGRAVTAQAVPESDWPAVFRQQGFPETSVQAFCGMFRGFNDGTVAFEGRHTTRRGSTTLRQALAKLLPVTSEGRREASQGR